MRAPPASRLADRLEIPARGGGALTIGYPQGELRSQLAYVGAEAVRAGLVIGSGGNLSAREPGSDQHKRAVNLEEAARATCAALRLTGGDPARIPQIPAAFLAAVEAAPDGPV